jgi:hypothetical protein
MSLRISRAEASLRTFEPDTADHFVEMIIEALRGDETLRHELYWYGCPLCYL